MLMLPFVVVHRGAMVRGGGMGSCPMDVIYLDEHIKYARTEHILKT